MILANRQNFSNRYRVKSIEEINNTGSTSAENSQANQGPVNAKPHRVVVYASLSDEARIRHVSAPYRRYIIFLACFQLTVLMIPPLWYLEDDDSFASRNYFDLTFLLLGSLSSLVALKRSKPWTFLLASLVNSGATLLAIFHGYLIASQPWITTCRILSVCIAVCQWYLNDFLREIHSPQMFQMKQEN